MCLVSFFHSVFSLKPALSVGDAPGALTRFRKEDGREKEGERVRKWSDNWKNAE